VRLNAAVRDQVRFRQDNLFDAGAFLGTAEYDVIFCRNVLIYFDREDQERTVSLLSRLLALSGMLFVGPSESALFLDHGFASVKSPLAFAFRKPGANVTRTPQLLRTQGAKSVKALARVSRPLAAARRPFVAITKSPPMPKPASEDWIASAQRMADEGKLIEALEICERGARTTPSAQAFYLAGLIVKRCIWIRRTRKPSSISERPS
jgi:chemotaxis protein methyltransferase WspC